MTECTPQKPLFASLGRKRIQADFSGGELVSDAGILLLREADRHLGLTRAISACIPDPRNPDAITHEQRSMLAQRIYAIALGYEDVNDHIELRHDAAMKVATEGETTGLGSSSTLCRLENRIDRVALRNIIDVFIQIFIDSHSAPPEELILDFDATDDPLHGMQEGRFFHGYYGNDCYLPLYVFCGEQLLVPLLRRSNMDAAKYSRVVLRWIVGRLRAAWPEVRIVVRADSGFCRRRFMRWCDRNNVSYILGLARNSRLKKLAAPRMQEAEDRFQESGSKQRLFDDFSYAAGTWDRARRVIVKAERLALGENLRFIVTNLPGEAQSLYDRVYCQRGEMENRIKEQQLSLFADRTSCHRFDANQVRLLLSSAAYILVEAIRRLGLQGTELAQAQAGTIRLKLFKIGAQVHESVRRFLFQMSGSYPRKDLFLRVSNRLCQLPSASVP